MASSPKKYLMSKINCQLSPLHGLIHVCYTCDERDTIIAKSILVRVTIPPNTKARVVFEPLFVGAHCASLRESGRVIWSVDANIISSRAFFIEEDATSNLMTVYIGSGQYTFQAPWHWFITAIVEKMVLSKRNDLFVSVSSFSVRASSDK